MYIQDSELASAFHEKETEYIENSEREILENYREFLGWCDSEEAQKRVKGSAAVRYRQFLNDFSREYQAFYREENGRTYSQEHGGKRNVFNVEERDELQKEYEKYLDSLFTE